MHSKPQEETPPPSRPAALTSSLTDEKNMDVDTNLIQLDTYLFFFISSILVSYVDQLHRMMHTCMQTLTYSNEPAQCFVY